MYLLDTNHCSRIIQGHPDILRRLAELADSPVATCVIVQRELIFMAEKSEQKAPNLTLVQAFLQDIAVYGVDRETAESYGRLKAAIIRHFGPRAKAKRRKTKIEELGIGENDLWIVSLALRYGLTIVSADSDFQRIQEVVKFPLESWLIPGTTPSTAPNE